MFHVVLGVYSLQTHPQLEINLVNVTDLRDVHVL